MTGSVNGGMRMNSNHWRVTLTGCCINEADTKDKLRPGTVWFIPYWNTLAIANTSIYSSFVLVNE